MSERARGRKGLKPDSTRWATEGLETIAAVAEDGKKRKRKPSEEEEEPEEVVTHDAEEAAAEEEEDGEEVDADEEAAAAALEAAEAAETAEAAEAVAALEADGQETDEGEEEEADEEADEEGAVTVAGGAPDLDGSLENGVPVEYRDITELLNLPQIEAARRLKLPMSTLSKRWKEAVRIRKWPYRQVAKLDKEIMTLLHNIPPRGEGEASNTPPEIEQALGILLRRRQEELRPVRIRM